MASLNTIVTQWIKAQPEIVTRGLTTEAAWRNGVAAFASAHPECLQSGYAVADLLRSKGAQIFCEADGTRTLRKTEPVKKPRTSKGHKPSFTVDEFFSGDFE